MKIEEERVEWDIESPLIKELVDKSIIELKKVGAPPVAYMAVDMIYRSFVKWLHSSKALRVNPELVRASIIYLMGVIITELSKRMASVDQYGNRHSSIEWAKDFINELAIDVANSIHEIDNKKHTQ